MYNSFKKGICKDKTLVYIVINIFTEKINNETVFIAALSDYTKEYEILCKQMIDS